MKVELKLRNILRQLKSADPKKRYEALDDLYQYKQQDDLQVQIEVLLDCIKAATAKFPKRVDHWDNPSYYLIDFVCDFRMPQIMESLMENFERLDLLAKERAIEFLLSTEDQKAFYFLEEKMVQLIQSDKLFRSIRELRAYPVLARNILNKTFDKIHTEPYKFMYYSLISSINESGLDPGYKEEKLLPILLEDYQTVLEDYLKYDSDYSTKFVYMAWKDSYLLIRNRLRLFINLMMYYFSPEVEKELRRALHFKDPIIKTDALIICLSKSLPYEQGILVETANHIESAELLYWKLLERNLQHLYPIQEEVQPHLAKTRFFNTMVGNPDEEGNFQYPEEIQIVDQLDAENVQRRLVRYYFIRFQMNNIDYVGWAGGYSLESEDPQGAIWDETYTDFVEFDSLSIEEHKQAFLDGKKKLMNVLDQHVFYESSPKLSTGAWFAIAVIVPFAIRFSYYLFNFPILNILIVIGLACSFSFIQVQRNKKRKVLIIGDQLVVKRGAKQNSIGLRNIEKVEYNQKHVLIYNKHHELTLKFPLSWVHYDLFQQQMHKNVAHYKDKPFIQS